MAELDSSHSRSSKMALAGPSLLAVEVKSSDPQDSINDQKSQPQADLLRQINQSIKDFI